MECGPSLGPEATVVASLRGALAPDAVVPPPTDLLAAFAAVPDPRRAQGRRFALPALLALAVSALLANQLSILAIAQWGARQRPALLQALGFRDGRTSHQSTLHRLFRAVDPAALSAAVSGHFATALPVPALRGAQGVAIDGKAQRGRLAFATTTGGTVHALSAYSHDGGIVLAQQEIRSTADKVEAELTVAPTLIARLDWHGRVMTGDALFCQRHLCTQLRAAGGDYLLLVKENQPTLYHDLARLFEPPAEGPSPWSRGMGARTTGGTSSPRPISPGTSTGRDSRRSSGWNALGGCAARTSAPSATVSPAYRPPTPTPRGPSRSNVGPRGLRTDSTIARTWCSVRTAVRSASGRGR